MIDNRLHEELEQFNKIINELVELKTRKAKDYGNSWRIFGLQGIINQIGSKFIRIRNLTKENKKPHNEALEDSFRDIANYAIMGIQLIQLGQTKDAFDLFEYHCGENLSKKNSNLQGGCGGFINVGPDGNKMDYQINKTKHE